MEYLKEQANKAQSAVEGVIGGAPTTTELHCANHTTCSRRVICAAEEKNVNWSYHHVDFKSGQQKSAAFKKLQPFGKVPVLREGDFVLFESRAIMRFLASKPGGSRLVPAKPEVVALMDQAISFEVEHFTPAFMPIYFERLLKPSKGLGETDETAVAAAIAKLGPALDVLDAMLEGKTYFVAEEFTLADLTFLPYVARFGDLKIGDMLASRENVAAWYARCADRPSWKYAMARKAVDRAPK